MSDLSDLAVAAHQSQIKCLLLGQLKSCTGATHTTKTLHLRVAQGVRFVKKVAVRKNCHTYDKKEP